MLLVPTLAFAQLKDNPFNDSYGSSALLADVLSTCAAELDVSAMSLTVLNEEDDIVSEHAGDSISDQSLFQAAFMSKSVTAVAVLLLANKHQIHLDEDVRPHITSLDWTRIKGGDCSVAALR